MWEDGLNDGSLLNEGGFFGGGPEEYRSALEEGKLSARIDALRRNRGSVNVRCRGLCQILGSCYVCGLCSCLDVFLVWSRRRVDVGVVFLSGSW